MDNNNKKDLEFVNRLYKTLGSVIDKLNDMATKEEEEEEDTCKKCNGYCHSPLFDYINSIEEEEPIESYGYIDDDSSQGVAKAKVITYILDGYKADHSKYDHETSVALAKTVSKTLDYIKDELEI